MHPNPNGRSSRRVPSTAPPAYDANASPWDYTPVGANNPRPTRPTAFASRSQRPDAASPQNDSASSASQKTWARSVAILKLKFLALIFLILCVCAAREWMTEDPLDPTVRDRLRRQWDKEIQGHQKIRQAWAIEVEQHDTIRIGWETEHMELIRQWDIEVEQHDIIRAGWEAERNELIAMRKQLVRDKEDWKDEKRGEARRKKEEQDRVRAKFYWEDLGADQHCLRYSTRQYTARVANVPRQYDPVQACKETAIEINGVKILNPVQCEDRGCSGVIGHWMVADPSCVTHFDGFADKGCTGPGSGRRLIESRLWNLQGGDDWRDMCSTTPADFRGLHFEGPDSCENWGIRGVWGTWNIEDRECF
ncbi:hypothetical protein B0H14DRAFT_3495369 [Mycena olivaceomarginata]|nr:hypothetical protein B0H14DRAFT_3495369 [Mycena olivaceomarginata]